MSTTSPQTTISLHHWRFLSFLGAQFLGAFNDNAFKLVISMAALSLFPDPKTQAGYIALISALAILPFLCFSGYAGYFADKYAKSTVLRISKALEIPAMGAALFIFSQPHPDMQYLMITLFFMAAQSTFFSPSKYGVLPEIIHPQDLAKANGYLNMLTFVAIITGSFIGSVLWGTYEDNPAIIGKILLSIAIVGTILCWFLPKTTAVVPNKPFKINPLNEILHSIPTMRQSRTLSAAMIGTAIYWLMGGLMYLALIMLGKTELGLSEAKSGSLFSFLALGIGLGSVAAGYILGKSVRRTLIVWGAVLLGSAGIACGFYATNYLNTAVLMLLAGLGAGLFIVPVMTLLQQHSPADKRGQIMAASSFFDMAGVLAASGVFWVLSAKLGLSASHIIMVAGGACFVGITLFLYSHKNTAIPTLGAQFIANAKQKPFSLLFSDTTGKRLNRIKTLVGARLLAKWLSPQLGMAQNTAILLPATVGGALVNIALSFLGKTSVNLNFSLGQESLQAALKQADVEHIITSRAFLAKLNISEADGMIFVEEAKKAISPITRLSALVQALLMPTVILQRLWLNSATVPTDTATILFSSGSTATPKGVCLSHENILSNINSVRVLLNQAEGKESYALTGILPFFHSFGFTVCVWLPSITGRRIAYHPNPLESKTVADMIAQEKCAILVCTPTFARQYVQAGKDGALQSVRLVITGGEKLNATTAQVLKAALPDAHILQGYGCTELGPVVAVNMPDSHLMGSVGRPIPRVNVQVVDVATGVKLPANQEGLIRVQSPAQMQGYYKNEALTNSVMIDGWYDTGDIGFLDTEGFLHITDRLSRFSKIGGEMVPHGKIEAVIEEILGEKAAVVVAVEDAQRGERLCVLLASVAYTPAQLFAALQQTGLPKLWIPRENSIFQVEAIPLLPTGKVDLQGCKNIVASS